MLENEIFSYTKVTLFGIKKCSLNNYDLMKNPTIAWMFNSEIKMMTKFKIKWLIDEKSIFVFGFVEK